MRAVFILGGIPRFAGQGIPKAGKRLSDGTYFRMSFDPVALSATASAICEKSRLSVFFGFRLAFVGGFFGIRAPCHRPHSRRNLKFKLTHYLSFNLL